MYFGVLLFIIKTFRSMAKIETHEYIEKLKKTNIDIEVLATYYGSTEQIK